MSSIVAFLILQSSSLFFGSFSAPAFIIIVVALSSIDCNSANAWQLASSLPLHSRDASECQCLYTEPASET